MAGPRQGLRAMGVMANAPCPGRSRTGPCPSLRLRPAAPFGAAWLRRLACVADDAMPSTRRTLDARGPGTVPSGPGAT